jgi:hypothetical protein
MAGLEVFEVNRDAPSSSSIFACFFAACKPRLSLHLVDLDHAEAIFDLYLRALHAYQHFVGF